MSTAILQLLNLFLNFILSKFAASFRVNNLAILLNITCILHPWMLV